MVAIYVFLIADKMMTIDTVVSVFKEKTLEALAKMGLDGYGNELESEDDVEAE